VTESIDPVTDIEPPGGDATPAEDERQPATA
jgi:hypothetical protein